MAIEDPMRSFGDNEESLKIRIWLKIQNGNLDQHQNAHCSVSDKGPYMSGVWWLNVMRFWRFAMTIACPEKKRITIITRMLQLQATVKRFQFDLHVNLEGQHMLISSWSQK